MWRYIFHYFTFDYFTQVSLLLLIEARLRLRPVGIAHSFGGCTLSRCTVTVSDSLQRVEWFGLFKLFTIHSVIEDPRLFECVTNSLVFAGLGVPIIQQFHKATLPTLAKFHLSQ